MREGHSTRTRLGNAAHFRTELARDLAADVPGVTGRLKMNAKRDVDKPAVIQELAYTNGDVKYIYKTTINPN